MRPCLCEGGAGDLQGSAPQVGRRLDVMFADEIWYKDETQTTCMTDEFI